MPVVPSYALVDIDAVPVEVAVDGARVIERGAGRVLHARRPGSGPFRRKIRSGLIGHMS
jgi:hypothetical protein